MNFKITKSYGWGHRIRVQIACSSDDWDDISLLCEGDTRGYVEFYSSHDQFRWMTSYKTSKWVQKIYRDRDTWFTSSITLPSTLPSTMCWYLTTKPNAECDPNTDSEILRYWATESRDKRQFGTQWSWMRSVVGGQRPLKERDYRTGINLNLYHRQLPYRKYREEPRQSYTQGAHLESGDKNIERIQ